VVNAGVADAIDDEPLMGMLVEDDDEDVFVVFFVQYLDRRDEDVADAIDEEPVIEVLVKENVEEVLVELFVQFLERCNDCLVESVLELVKWPLVEFVDRDEDVVESVRELGVEVVAGLLKGAKDVLDDVVAIAELLDTLGEGVELELEEAEVGNELLLEDEDVEDAPEDEELEKLEDERAEDELVDDELERLDDELLKLEDVDVEDAPADEELARLEDELPKLEDVDEVTVGNAEDEIDEDVDV